MKIGVPKEIKTHEYRVGLTPGAVREYVAAGHTVLVETNAGEVLAQRTTCIAKPAQRLLSPLARCSRQAR